MRVVEQGLNKSQSPIEKFLLTSHPASKVGEKIKIRSPQRPRCGLIIREVIFESGLLKR
jgi:hypothetical protein